MELTTDETTPEAIKAAPKTADQIFEDAVVAAKKANPGTDVFEYQHPTLSDARVLFRGMTSSEYSVYRKTLAAQQARGEIGNLDLAYEHAAFAAVLVPGKPGLIDMLARYPALSRTVAGEICEATGIDQNAKSKKR